MPRKLYGAAAKAHAKKMGKKKHAKKHAAKKHAAKKHHGTFAQGVAAGISDVKHGRPLRKVGARKDDYSIGYRNGVAQGRREKRRHKR